jgi:hypothetical protein
MAGAALLSYRARHAVFPDCLEDTIPEPSLDPFSGQPFRYHRERDGFVVFSVGAEGTFDGGEPGTKIVSREIYFRWQFIAPRIGY